MAREKEAKKKEILFFEGRMINGSLREKDKYNEKAVAAYKIEVAVKAGGPEDDRLWGALCDYAEDRWGAAGVKDLEDGIIVNPLLDGEKLALKRERRGKEGDAYKGTTVVRANTVFNADGNDAPGGVAVFNEDAERLDFLDTAAWAEIYNGCEVKVGVTISDYEGDDGDGLKFYLVAVQKIGDGVKLTSARDFSGVFKPTGRQRSGGGERRSRARGEEPEGREEPRRRSRGEDDEPRRRSRGEDDEPRRRAR